MENKGYSKEVIASALYDYLTDIGLLDEIKSDIRLINIAKEDSIIPDNYYDNYEWIYTNERASVDYKTVITVNCYYKDSFYEGCYTNSICYYKYNKGDSIKSIDCINYNRKEYWIKEFLYEKIMDYYSISVDDMLSYLNKRQLMEIDKKIKDLDLSISKDEMDLERLLNRIKLKKEQRDELVVLYRSKDYSDTTEKVFKKMR